jgi:branched-chain amino acid aminotransferase
MIHTVKSKQQGWKKVDFSSLEFGQIPTDHMFVNDFGPNGWQEAQIVPYSPMSYSPFTAAFHYGQTVFEGLKAYRTKSGQISIFRPKDHARRFNRSLERMCMPTVPEGLFLYALNELLKIDSEWVPNLDGSSLYVRPFMFATQDKLGVHISERYRFMIVCTPVGQYYSRPLSVKIEQEYARAFPGGSGFAKCGGNYGISFYPYKKAHDEGFDQIIWTDAATHTYVEESGTMNIGFIVDKKLITPPAGETILKGITRDSLLAIASEAGFCIEERPIGYRDILSLIENGKKVEAFGIGTAATIAPIERIYADGKVYQTHCAPNAHMFTLKKRLEAIRIGEAPDSWNWNWMVK